MKPSYFNIHDLISIQIHSSSNCDNSYISRRLGYFESIPGRTPSIVVYFNVHPEKERKRSERPLLYDKSHRRLGRWTVHITEDEDGRSEIVFWGNRYSQKYLFFNFLEPIINYHLTKHNASMVHASCFAMLGKGYIVNAFPSSGKTSILLRMLDRGADYLSDEMTIIMADGRAFSYPTPVIFYDYNITHNLEATLPKGVLWKKYISSVIRQLSRNKVKLPIVELLPTAMLKGGKLVSSCKVTNSYVIGCKDDSQEGIKQYLLDINRFQYRYFDFLLRKHIKTKGYSKILDYWSRMESIIALFCANTKTTIIQFPSEFNISI